MRKLAAVLSININASAGASLGHEIIEEDRYSTDHCAIENPWTQI